MPNPKAGTVTTNIPQVESQMPSAYAILANNLIQTRGIWQQNILNTLCIIVSKHT